MPIAPRLGKLLVLGLGRGVLYIAVGFDRIRKIAGLGSNADFGCIRINGGLKKIKILWVHILGKGHLAKWDCTHIKVNLQKKMFSFLN